MTPVIKVEGLGKRYRIGDSVPYRTLREGLVNAVGAPYRLMRQVMQHRGSESHRSKSQIWALRDVSFEVMPGEVLGVIGRNGAGKSTLLKVLSRITDPTEGRAQLRGRVGSLLEVGTGFHPELTGRENIYLSGAILGMRHAEVARKFDEILDFAGVERFVDTPIKHFSSGMYMRLAFAVAAHLETEILLVDEVLAVGDQAFQKKCLGKMREVGRAGRTVLFVSHNMASIEALSDACLLLQNGRLVKKGPASELIQHYVREARTSDASLGDLSAHSGRDPGCRPCMNYVTLSSGSEHGIGAIRMNSRLSIAVDFNCTLPIDPVLGLVVRTSQGSAVFGVNNLFIGGFRFAQRIKAGSIRCSFDSLPLLPGTYFLDLWLNNGDENLDMIQEAISFEVLPMDIFRTGQLPDPKTGPIFWPATFSLATSSGDDAYDAHA